MSFGGGFGGFGQNTNNNQASTFGGFGQNNNNSTPGFGGNTTGGFGQNNNAGGGLFGSNTANTGASNNSTFGSGGTGGFGSGTGFGSKPAFGSTTTTGGGGLFGSSTTNNTSTGFGGFGNTANNNNTASPFGGGNTTGGGMFGASNNKPAFGASTTTGGSLFGGGNATTTTSTGFGGGFGATNNAAVGDPPGTAVAPFQAHTEKEANSTATNSFQNILFQDPYKKWSAEELRLADYVQGRRHGNASGGGAFGVGSNFGGGFGSNNQTSAFGSNTNNTNTTGGLFGSNNAASATPNTNAGGFGSTSAFGSNTNGGTGGLFGNANKPTGGLFGSGTTQQTTGGFGTAQSGGAFGSTANTTNAFGSSNTGSGLFGANKPQTGGLFGSGTTNTATTGFGGTNNAFSSSNTTGGGLFGNNNTATQPTGGGLFGNNTANQQPQQNTGGVFGGGFGQQNQGQPAGTSLFGNSQQKPATGGLFGSTPSQPAASGGLFGNTNQQQQTNSAFGAPNTATSGGGLFGGAKPNTGTGMFGGTNTQTNTNTGGLFGGLGNNNQNQPSAGTGLFGAASNNQQQKTGLFGNSTQNSSTGLFGNSTNQGQGTGLFGSMNNQQQQGGGLGNSLLGNSQQASNTPQGLTANLNDVSAYGSPSLFSSLHSTEVNNPGPLATPLSSSAKPKRGSILAMSKMAPSSASRYGTPQKRAYGFSYSTYGTPGGSPASSIASTPGTLGRSLLASSSSGSLSKSMSVNNLRRNFNAEDSILAPGAFSSSSGPRWYGSTGSKKLVISRDIRSDLFSTPQKDKQHDNAASGSRKLSKRVSFEVSNGESEGDVQIRGALPAPEDSPSTQAEDTPRQNRQSGVLNGSRASETDPAVTNDLRDIHEEDPLATPNGTVSHATDKMPGEYYSRPSLEELQSMNRIQRQSIDKFVIGRENVGSISFKYPVDITAIEPEELYGGIIQLEPRSATVYPNPARKPPVGKGLNVPAQISLEQSWPRSSRDKKFPSDEDRRVRKHVERLQRIPDTTFESYDKNSGVWVFSVEHFTTYGLDDSEDSDEETQVFDETPSRGVISFDADRLDMSMNSEMEDDTFNFKQSRTLPGAFNQPVMMEQDISERQSFLGVSSADSVPNNVPLSVDEYSQDMGEEYDLSDDEDMTRSVGQHLAAEQDDESSEPDQGAPRGTPGGVLRARMRAIKDSVEPMKLEVADGDDWMEMLRKSVSPIKRDRQVLKLLNESPRYGGDKLISFDDDEAAISRASVWKKSTVDKVEVQANPFGSEAKRGFATSIDLMNSLFEKPQPTPIKTRVLAPASKGFPQWPYERQDKNLALQESEKAFHDAGRPTWGPDETVVLTRPVASSSHVIRVKSAPPEPSKRFLGAQDKLTDIRTVDNVPFASLHKTNLQQLFHHQDMNTPSSVQEQRVWQLASILFDDLPDSQTAAARSARLTSFWTDLVESVSSTSIGLARLSEEKAVACLAGHRITEACKYLFDGKNFRLAALVALIGTSDFAAKEMKEQVKAWHESKVLSEFSDPIRVIYELLSGNTCVCEGMKNVPVEDRMESFVISKKFGLDWRQAFGLRLWYGISQSDRLEAAVESFAQDVKQDKEARPLPWFQVQGIQPLWDDPHPDQRQDLLWGLLQLYADKNADLEAILHPANTQLSPLDMRLSWQLGLALVATGKVSYGESAHEKADAATIAYASQLTAAGEWLEAIFVLLHLHEPTARARAIQEHIGRHAGLIGPEGGENFAILTDKFLIPVPWVWEALALFNRSVLKDSTAEVQCLLKAGSFIEAHRVLIQTVAPRAIIERGYAELSALMAQFDGQQDAIPEWQLGGEVYNLFLSLLQHRHNGETASRGVLDRLVVGLHAISDSLSASEIVRYAALSDMADETANEILHWTRKKQDAEFRSRILQLPLTQDRLLAYSVDLGMERYMEVMSH